MLKFAYSSMFVATFRGTFAYADKGIGMRLSISSRSRLNPLQVLSPNSFLLRSHCWVMVPVYAPKNFPGMSESTFLSRSFGDQGVRLRIRKEPRTIVWVWGLNEYKWGISMLICDVGSVRCDQKNILGNFRCLIIREQHQELHLLIP